jgi:hypothetical protein
MITDLFRRILYEIIGTGKKLSLDSWDWIALSVALVSLVVAVASFIIARRTLKSQRQTEDNTMPIITMGIQQILLNEFILKMLDGHIRLTALWYILEKGNYSQYPSEYILNKILIPLDTIHIQLFYKPLRQKGQNNDEDYSRYRLMQGLLDRIKEYNNGIYTLNIHLKDNTIKKEILNNEFYNVLSSNDRIADSWGKIMTLIFGYDTTKKSSIFDLFLNTIKDESVSDDISFKYYRKDEVYASFFDDDLKRNKLLLFMENTTIELMDDFSRYLIDK